MIVFAVIFALLLGVCIFFGLPSARTWQRVTSAATFVLLIGVVYGGSVDLLGWPKPLRLEWRSADEATVLAARMREGKAIYVWLESGDATEPRSYVLPWNMETAQQLQNALQERESKGSKVQMTMAPGSGGGDGTPKFYAQPQPSPPPKDAGAARPVMHWHPDT